MNNQTWTYSINVDGNHIEKPTFPYATKLLNLIVSSDQDIDVTISSVTHCLTFFIPAGGMWMAPTVPIPLDQLKIEILSQSPAYVRLSGIHDSTFKLNGTVTGRFSSMEPNLSQPPREIIRYCDCSSQDLWNHGCRCKGI